MRLSDFDFSLPADRIAQRPVEPRDASRLLVLDRASATRRHLAFRDLPELLRPGDLVVLNDTRVIPARLFGRRATGGKLECLLVRDRGDARWEALLRAGGRLRPGERITLGDDALVATLLEKAEDATWLIRFEAPGGLREAIERAGRIPLPPYIERAADEVDRSRYQTVFARADGAVAAPTAGLHFTPALLERLEAVGIERAFVTLHVGPGTFRPIETPDVRDHRMHAEAYEVGEAARRSIERARARGGRVVACGTTAVRTLETFAATGAPSGETSIYIYPGYAFRAVDAMITNFHLPRSSLILLVAAFAGRDVVLDAYREAIELGYRFYSYGDAMLIL